jgi:trk system potassium uptake protein TrkA
MFVLVVGAGRVGSSAGRRALEEGHTVSVLDRDPLSLERLDRDQETTWEAAGGRFTVGPALASEALIAAGVEQADVFIAATRGDNTNLVVAQIAQRRFDVGRVIARVLDPARAEWYSQRGGIETICGTSRAIDLIEQSFTGAA